MYTQYPPKHDEEKLADLKKYLRAFRIKVHYSPNVICLIECFSWMWSLDLTIFFLIVTRRNSLEHSMNWLLSFTSLMEKSHLSSLKMIMIPMRYWKGRLFSIHYLYLSFFLSSFDHLPVPNRTREKFQRLARFENDSIEVEICVVFQDTDLIFQTDPYPNTYYIAVRSTECKLESICAHNNSIF